ncbi:protein of unknown function [Candidatus Filomicrobium marinum]|nr:protein of unknown function [Candidatus Filomicrobium marinum]
MLRQKFYGEIEKCGWRITQPHAEGTMMPHCNTHNLSALYRVSWIQ